MEKRLIIAVVASVAILYMFQAMQPVRSPDYVVDKTETEAATPPVRVEEKRTEAVIAETDKPSETPSEEKTLTITNTEIEIEVSSLGSGLKSFNIYDEKEGFVNLINTVTPPLPLSAAFAPDENWTLRKTETGVTAQLSTPLAAYYREFYLDKNNIVNIKNRVVNLTDRRLIVAVNQSWRGGLGTTEDLMDDNPKENSAFAQIDSKVQTDIESGSYSGAIEWAGISNKYFLAVFLELEEYYSKLEVEFMRVNDERYPSVEASGQIEIAPGEEVVFTQRIYGGLKDYRAMKGLAEGLEGILSFGFFGFLSRLFLNLLIFFNSIVGNYGLAIILLTFVLQFFFIPLTVKSYKSMHAMKALQPEIEKLRKKYKENPQRMNQEMMAMYKKRGVNPLSGCFPLLLQMPVFIALFVMLREVAELRYAGFLWITDLAAPDRLFAALPVLKDIPYVGQYGPLPFLMGGAMFLQQKVTAGSQGPQKSLTYMMPIIFTFLFMGFPSGLLLYWFVNSIITFIIQFFIGKKETVRR